MSVKEIPTERVVSVEHPCIIQNLERGLKSLGGEPQLKHVKWVLEHRVGDSRLSNRHAELPEPMAGASLRPGDPFAKKLTSTGIETRNVLIKVTLPKRTGRKRKRGSNEPFTSPESAKPQSTNPTATELLQRMRESERRYDIQPVTVLYETHRFRGLPDFQLSSRDIPILRELRKHAMKPDYEKLKKFHLDLSASVPNNVNFPGPPSFANMDIPYKYDYQQAPGIVVVKDESGNLISQNMMTPQKRITWGLPPDVAEIPQGPPPNLRPSSLYGEQLTNAIAALEKLLMERPLVTKRVAINALPPVNETIFKEATQWVGYSFKAGPWRDSLIRYGVDPRKHPRYRIYQTLMFQVEKEFVRPATVSDNTEPGSSSHLPWMRTVRYKRGEPTTHVFDGKSVSTNGKTWQICDITDPTIADILNTEDIREECDAYQWGWYQNGTICKARVIMKDKMRHLLAGEVPPEEVYKSISTMPNRLVPGQMQNIIYPQKIYGLQVMVLATEVRAIAKTGEGQRVYKSKKGKGPGDVEQDAIRMGQEHEEEEAEEQGEAGGEEYVELEGNVDDLAMDVEDDDQGDFGEMEEDEDETEEGARDDGTFNPA